MGVLSDNDSKLLGMVTDIVSSERSSPIQASRIMGLIQQEIAKARRSERLEVALDNYRGQTFSESTDYKSKFDKFVRNNEIRIEQLTLKEHKEQSNA